MKTIVQFGFRRHGNVATDRDFPLVNCTVIPNPWRGGKTMTDEQYKAKVRRHPLFAKLVADGVALLEKYETIGVGCQFGRHRSGAVADEIAKLTGATVVVVSSS